MTTIVKTNVGPFDNKSKDFVPKKGVFVGEADACYPMDPDTLPAGARCCRITGTGDSRYCGKPAKFGWKVWRDGENVGDLTLCEEHKDFR